MTPSNPQIDFDLELDRYVAELEQAGGASSIAELARYAPVVSHSRYEDILVELMRVDMELANDRGEARRPDAYLAQYGLPALESPAWKSLCAEEARLRRKSQTHPNLPSPVPTRFPKLEDEIAGFRLKEQIGKGAFSRVYRAQDLRLAERDVVLKFSKHFAGEAQVLSRLQHKNIVPIYSWHRYQDFYVVCMPFLGRTTLADLLSQLEPTRQPLSGKALISTLDARASATWRTPAQLPGESGTDTETLPGESNAAPSLIDTSLWKRLQDMDSARVALWILAELADGLQHAHAREILHRDLKPANILLTHDGLPMLLDFNLASDAKSHASDRGVGGTLAYMSPEQIETILDGTNRMDARSDIYSLGLILHELLYQKRLFEESHRSTPVDPSNEQLRELLQIRQQPLTLQADSGRKITLAMVSILRKCLELRPEQRYASVADLATDLRAQLEHRPLVHATDRSIRERVQKWNRRHPRLSVSTIGLMAGLFLSLAIGFVWLQSQKNVRRLEALDWTRRGNEARMVARSLIAGPSTPTAQLKMAIQVCDDWLQREQTSQSLSELPAADRSEAMELMDQVQLYRARGRWRLASQHGNVELLPQIQKDCQAIVKRSSRQYEIAKILLDAVDATEKNLKAGLASEQAFDPALLSRPTLASELATSQSVASMEAANAWYWLGLAQLHYELGDRQQAISDARTACTLDDALVWPHYLLGYIACESRDFVEAKRHLTAAIERKSDLPEAYFNRAIALIGLGEFAKAIDDLNYLEANHHLSSRLFLIRELAHRRLGSHLLADADRKKGLAEPARDALGWNAQGEAWLRSGESDSDSKAKHCFEQAILRDPNLRNAYENLAYVVSEKQKRPDEAIAILGKAIERTPDYALAWSSRGVLHARLGHRQEAIADIQQALQRDRAPMVCYQAASGLAFVQSTPEDRKQILDLLRETLRGDLHLAALMTNDPDLASFHNDSEFQSLLSAARQLRP